MSTVEFKAACAAHRKCCPYKATGMTKCGANENTAIIWLNSKEYSKSYQRNEAINCR